MTCFKTEKPVKLLCQQCHALVELELPPADGVKCTCGNNNLVRLNLSPKNGDIDRTGPPPWEYVCQKCNTYFCVPVPRGPDEAQRITCPDCGGKDIERFHVCRLEDIEHAFG